MSHNRNNYAELIEANGFVHVAGLLDSRCVRALIESVHDLGERQSAPGIRDLAAKSSTVRDIATSASVRALIDPILGSKARLVRSILFTKTAESNWGVAWHQDLSIAVRSRKDTPGYSGWSVKEGITHIQPPELVLDQMVALRIHLDPTDESNGALMVSPGSHKIGRIPANEAAIAAGKHGKHTCVAAAGDGILMRPLVLHASSKSRSERPRRVIHFEFAGVRLPTSLEWNDAA